MPPLSQPSASNQPTAVVNKKRLLIVEDDFYIRDLYSLQATREGFEVVEAGDGEEAIQKSKSENFNIILVDLMIPKIDGITLIKTLKEDPKFASVPCIVITNLEDATKEQEAKAAGASAYLLKIKNTPETVINAVKTYIQ